MPFIVVLRCRFQPTGYIAVKVWTVLFLAFFQIKVWLGQQRSHHEWKPLDGQEFTFLTLECLKLACSHGWSSLQLLTWQRTLLRSPETVCCFFFFPSPFYTLRSILQVCSVCSGRGEGVAKLVVFCFLFSPQVKLPRSRSVHFGKWCRLLRFQVLEEMYIFE